MKSHCQAFFLSLTLFIYAFPIYINVDGTLVSSRRSTYQRYLWLNRWRKKGTNRASKRNLGIQGWVWIINIASCTSRRILKTWTFCFHATLSLVTGTRSYVHSHPKFLLTVVLQSVWGLPTALFNWMLVLHYYMQYSNLEIECNNAPCFGAVTILGVRFFSCAFISLSPAR